MDLKKLFLFIGIFFFLFGCTEQVTQTPIEIEEKESVVVSFEVISGEEKLFDTSFSVESGTNAFEALKQATEVEFKQYEFGVFIEGIAGIKADQRQYWALYVNEVYSEKGIDQVSLDKDSKIKFVLEEIQ